MSTTGWTDYIIVAFVGAFVGLGELVARYRDAPDRALRNLPAAVYVGLNAVAAALALKLIVAFELDFGASGDRVRWLRGIVAGVGSMAFFRSSVFLVRVGDADVGVGPSSFLQVLLDASDRGVDRMRASTRAKEVERVMATISYARAETALPTLCLALMQNVGSDQQAALANDLKELRDADFDDRIKSLVLGLKLMNVVGPDVLLEAVQALGTRITAARRIELPDGLSMRPREVRALVPRVFGPARPPAKADVDGADGEVELDGVELHWETGDERVVRVDSAGRLEAVDAGSTVVTARLDGIERSIAVRIDPADA